MDTIDDITHGCVQAAKTGAWHNCKYVLRTEKGDDVVVGIKSFGLWVQILRVGGLTDSIPEQKTQKAFKAALRTAIEGMLNHA